MKIWTVYEATCLATGRSYIGITGQPYLLRWRGHIRDSRNPKKRAPFLVAIRAYGKEAFTFEPICASLTRHDACAVERAIIADRNTLVPDGYNLTPGGDGGSEKGRQFSENHRRALSEAAKNRVYGEEYRAICADRQRGKKQSQETKQKHREAWLGRQHSEESREKMRDAQLSRIAAGYQHSEQTREKLRISHLGIVQSAKTRAKKSEALKGRKRPEVAAKLRGRIFSPEQRARMSAGKTGLPFSDEHRQNLSTALKAYWARRRGEEIAS